MEFVTVETAMSQVRFDTAAIGRMPGEPKTASTLALQDCLRTWDVIALTLGGLASVVADGHRGGALLPIAIATAFASCWIAESHGYKVSMLGSLPAQVPVLLSAALVWFVAGVCVSLLMPLDGRVPASVFAFAAAAGLMLLAGSRIGTVWLVRSWARAGRLDRQVAVVGLNEMSRSLIEELQRVPSSRLRIFGVYRMSDDPARVTHAGLLVRGDIVRLIEHSRRRMFDLVVFAPPPGQKQSVREMCHKLAGCACGIAVLTDLGGLQPSSAELERLGSGWALSVSPRPLRGARALQKSILDRTGAALLLVLLAPALLLLALAVRYDTPGPILFRQLRLGFNNEPFAVLKLRTMYHHLEDPLAEYQTTRDDPRVTPVGRWLRKFSLDELPQLLNVFTGDMSLVGPRPHAPGTKAGARGLEEAVAEYAMRNRVKPGITGWAQINGCRGAIGSEEQLRARVMYDLDYINNWSLLLDLKILLLTTVKGFTGPGAF